MLSIIVIFGRIICILKLTNVVNSPNMSPTDLFMPGQIVFNGNGFQFLINIEPEKIFLKFHYDD